MRFIKPSYEIMQCPDGEEVLRLLEAAARTCYKSEGKIHRGQIADADDYNGDGPTLWAEEPSNYKLVRKLLRIGHLSVIEHCSVTVRFVVNRGVTHELVRHRLASYSQESTRYCNYSKDDGSDEKHGGLNIIEPSHRPVGYVPIGGKGATDEAERRRLWDDCLEHIEKTYLKLIELGEKPQEARDILPIGLKTEIVTTANLREWRHIFALRAINERAHPQIREVMLPLLADLQQRIPIIFEDLALTELHEKLENLP